MTKVRDNVVFQRLLISGFKSKTLKRGKMKCFTGGENEAADLLNEVYPRVQASEMFQEQVWKQVLQEVSEKNQPMPLIFGIKPVYWAAGMGLIAVILIISGITTGYSV